MNATLDYRPRETRKPGTPGSRAAYVAILCCLTSLVGMLVGPPELNHSLSNAVDHLLRLAPCVAAIAGFICAVAAAAMSGGERGRLMIVIAIALVMFSSVQANTYVG